MAPGDQGNFSDRNHFETNVCADKLQLANQQLTGSEILYHVIRHTAR